MMTKSELKSKLKAIIDKKQRVFATMHEVSNPQMLVVKNKMEAELQAFNAVLDALNGNNAMLNCY